MSHSSSLCFTEWLWSVRSGPYIISWKRSDFANGDIFTKSVSELIHWIRCNSRTIGANCRSKKREHVWILTTGYPWTYWNIPNSWIIFLISVTSFYQSRFAPTRAEVSGLQKEYRKKDRIGKKEIYFTKNSFSIDILCNIIFWRGTGVNLFLAKN